MGWREVVCPELVHVETEKREKVFSDAIPASHMYAIAMLLFLVVVLSPDYLLELSLSSWLEKSLKVPLSSWAKEFLERIEALLVLGGVAGAYLWWRRKRIRLHVRRHLLTNGFPICLRCGYRLEGNVSERCPECGRPCGTGA